MKRILFLLLFSVVLSSVFAYEAKYYVVPRSSNVTLTGVAPVGSSANFVNSNTTNSGQIINSGKYVMLTLSGYDGMSITNVILSMKSPSCGYGTLSIKIGTIPIYEILNKSFDNPSWGGTCDNVFRDLIFQCNNALVSDESNLIIKIGAMFNDLYIESFTIEYTATNANQLTTPTNLNATSITSSSATLSWGKIKNASSYEVYITDNNQYVDTILSQDTIINSSNIKHSTEYYYSVKALSSNPLYNHSEQSEVKNFSTLIGEKYTVTFNVGAGISTETSLTEIEYKSGVLLPTVSLSGILNDEYEFLGWSPHIVNIESNSKPNLLYANDIYLPVFDTALYAVYGSRKVFATKITELKTSFTEPNDKWVIKKKSAAVDLGACWTLFYRDTIFSPYLFENTYIYDIKVNARYHKPLQEESISMVVNHNANVLAIRKIESSTINQYIIPLNKYLSTSGSICFLSSYMNLNFGLGIESISLLADIPLFRYLCYPKSSLIKPNVITEVDSTHITLYWSAVDSVDSYSIKLNDEIVVSNLSKTTHSYTINNLVKNKEYKISVVANSNQTTNAMYSVTELKITTLNSQVEEFKSQNGASLDNPTNVDVSSLSSNYLHIEDYVNVNFNTPQINVDRITVDKNGQFTVPEGKQLTVDRIILKSLNNSVSKVNLDGNIHTNLGLQIEKTITDNSKYFFFSIPFDCPIDFIKAPIGEDLGIYGIDWVISRYDENIRATKYKDILVGRQSAWIDLTENDIVQANVGYIIANGTDTPKTFIFPQTKNTNTLLSKDTQLSISVSSPIDETEEAQTQIGWNLICVPSYTTYNNCISYTGSGSVIENIPISIPDDYGVDYKQGLSSDFHIDPFHSFFVQAPGSGTLNFLSRNTHVKNNSDDNYLEKIKVYITNGDEKNIDFTTITFQDSAPNDYWLAYDLEKMSSFTVNPQIFTIDHSMKLAVNARGIKDKDTVNLSVYIPEAGEYKIFTSLDDNIYLLDQYGENIYTNSAIQFDVTEKGFINDRFKVVIDRSSTLVCNIYNEDSIVFYSKNGIVTIDNITPHSIISLFSITGILVDQTTTINSFVSFRNLEQGIYIIQVNNHRNNKLYKIIL